MRPLCAILVSFGILASTGCTNSPPQSEYSEIAWPVTDTLLSASSDVIGHPTALAAKEDGGVFVLDALNAEIHAFTSHHVYRGSIGGEGAGPGEMRRPSSFWVDPTVIWVVDQGNGRVQGLSFAGEMTASGPLPPEASSTRPRIGPGGQLLVSGWGQDSTLVRHFDRQGHLIRRIGTPPAPAPEFLDMVAIRSEIASGQVPGFFMNQVIPVLSTDGGIWAARQGDGVIQRYDSLGNLVSEFQLQSDEFPGVLEAFFARNRSETERPGFFPLRYFADAKEVGGELWLLLNKEDERTAVILSVSPEAGLVRKILLPGVLGAKSFAVDPDGGKIFLGIPSAATILGVTMEFAKSQGSA